jgi:hypothetical protein
MPFVYLYGFEFSFLFPINFNKNEHKINPKKARKKPSKCLKFSHSKHHCYARKLSSNLALLQPRFVYTTHTHTHTHTDTHVKFVGAKKLNVMWHTEQQLS